MRIRTEILLSISFLIIVVVSYVVSNIAINNIRRDIRKYTDILARNITELMISGSPQLDTLMNYVEIPIVLVDNKGNIRYVRGYPQDMDFVRKEVEKLRRKGNYIDIYYENFYIGRLYFGEPPSIRYLSLLPWILLIIVLITFFLVFLSVRGAVRYESERFWNIFAKGLAHQLGNPVTSLNAYLEILRRKCEEEEVSGMEEALDRVNSILRRFSKIGSSPSMGPVSLRRAVEKAMESLLFRIGGFPVKVEGDCVAYGDEELLVWVFENLIKNAYESKRGRREDGMKIRIYSANSSCIVDVEDYGMGIPRRVRKNLFQRDITTKKEGWGIGLMLVRRIMEMHGGSIRLLESKEGLTKFRLIIPAYKGKSEVIRRIR